MFKIEKQMRKERKDIVRSKYIGDENINLKMKEEEVMERWRSYFSSLLNETNEDIVEGLVSGVTVQTDCGASTEEHQSRQGTGAVWGHKRPYIIKAAGATAVKRVFSGL